MIISASRRTDIPAFFSEWFMNRIKEGYFINVNPFNPKQKKEISLSPDDIEAIVFWSKYPKPLIKYLPYLDELGYRYYFQFTLNHYPLFETGLPSLSERIEIFQELSEIVGPARVIWRYDPVFVSNLTPISYHDETFSNLAGKLKGFSHRVMISFVDIYDKVNTKMKQFSDLKLLGMSVPENVELLEKLLFHFTETAARYHLQIFSCAEKIPLEKYGIKPGSCIDAQLINKIFGLQLNLKKDKSQREECRCAPAVDMGIYDTCGFHCLYCYANRNQFTVERKLKKHQVENPILIE